VLYRIIKTNRQVYVFLLFQFALADQSYKPFRSFLQVCRNVMKVVERADPKGNKLFRSDQTY